MGCYLTKPAQENSDIQESTSEERESNAGTDGDKLSILRPAANKLCFPASEPRTSVPDVLASLQLTGLFCLPLRCAVPFVLPQTPLFRKLTNTEGVNFKAVSYAKYCAGDGVAQQTARAFEQFGINATDNSLPGKAAVLRTGEAIDAVHSAVNSANAEIPLESAGYLMCSIVQLGGILYGTLVIVGALVLLSLFPLCNCCGRFWYDLLCFTAGAATQGGGADDEPRIRQRPRSPDTIPLGTEEELYYDEDTEPQEPQEPPPPNGPAVLRELRQKEELDQLYSTPPERQTNSAAPMGFFAGLINAMGDPRRRRGRGGRRVMGWLAPSPPDSPEEQGQGELHGLLGSRGRGRVGAGRGGAGRLGRIV